MLATTMLSGTAGVCRAAISDCIDATCRITASDGGRGSGCVFEIDQGTVYVLTAAHVVGTGAEVQCEFWRHGHQSAPLAGRVTGRSEEADAAIVALPEASLGGVLPAVIPLAPRDYAIHGGDTLTSVGCANGGWATSWKGHALSGNDGDLHFLPTPANGRSGSAVFDGEGRQIVAIVRARTGDNSEGIATPVQAIYRAFDSGGDSNKAAPHAGATTHAAAGGMTPVQCGPNGCPAPQAAPNYLLPYRNRQDAQNRNGPWPSMPPAKPPVDISPLDEKLGRIASLLEDLKRNGTTAATPQAGDTHGPAVDEQARRAAEMALGQMADLRAESERNMRDVKSETAKASEAVERIKDSIAENGTVSERFHARVDKVKAELDEKLGHEASDRDVRIAYVKDLIQEKMGDGSLLKTVGLLAGVALVIWLVTRDVQHKLVTGDPLAVEKLAGLVESKFGGLQEKFETIKERLQSVATSTAATATHAAATSASAAQAVQTVATHVAAASAAQAQAAQAAPQPSAPPKAGP
jgi:hypothetical protein